MNREKQFFHLFYGLFPLFIYFGVTMMVVVAGDHFRWTTDILNFVNGLLNLIVLYCFSYRIYNVRGGSREIPPLFPCVRKESGYIEKNVLSEDLSVGKWELPFKAYVWIAVLGACSCVALNNWFSVFGLFEKIKTYDKVAESIYYGSLWMIFVRTAVLAPLVEEILVRGMVYRGLSCVIGRIPGMIGSALIFAWMHGNFLQGIYAFLLGMLFAYVYDMSGRNILAPILAHMAANVISVLGTSVSAVSGFLSEYFYILTGLTTILMVIAVVEIYHSKKQCIKKHQN